MKESEDVMKGEAPAPRGGPIETLKPGTYLRERGVLAVLPFSRATLWRRVSAGDFPAPIKFGERITVWKADEVRSWVEAQEADAAKRAEA